MYAGRMREMVPICVQFSLYPILIIIIINWQMEAKVTPSDTHLSGLLAFQVHQLANLELPNIRGSVAGKTSKKSSSSAALDASGNVVAPSTYCALTFCVMFGRAVR